MDDDISIKFLFNPTDDIFKIFQEKTAAYFKDKDINLYKATVMVVNELVENAVKYGIAINEKKGVDFEFSGNGSIVIKVTNKVASNDNLRNVIKYIDEINQSNNVQDLYVNRLHEFLDNPIEAGVSQIGLYKIAFEGKFKLKYEINGMMLSIIAVRDI